MEKLKRNLSLELKNQRINNESNILAKRHRFCYTINFIRFECSSNDDDPMINGQRFKDDVKFQCSMVQLSNGQCQKSKFTKISKILQNQ